MSLYLLYIFNDVQCNYYHPWELVNYNPKQFQTNLCLAIITCALQRYLAELVLAQQPLPRRQEAESLKFTSGGITQTALVTHEEVQQWATGSRNAIMCSISHAWETREHPDPCRQGTGFVLELVFVSHNTFGTPACHYFPPWFP